MLSFECAHALRRVGLAAHHPCACASPAFPRSSRRRLWPQSRGRCDRDRCFPPARGPRSDEPPGAAGAARSVLAWPRSQGRSVHLPRVAFHDDTPLPSPPAPLRPSPWPSLGSPSSSPPRSTSTRARPTAPRSLPSAQSPKLVRLPQNTLQAILARARSPLPPPLVSLS